jgi:hypothetical protein
MTLHVAWVVDHGADHAVFVDHEGYAVGQVAFVVVDIVGSAGLVQGPVAEDLELSADALPKGIRGRPGINADSDDLGIVRIELRLSFDEALQLTPSAAREGQGIERQHHRPPFKVREGDGAPPGAVA